MASFYRKALILLVTLVACATARDGGSVDDDQPAARMRSPAQPVSKLESIPSNKRRLPTQPAAVKNATLDATTPSERMLRNSLLRDRASSIQQTEIPPRARLGFPLLEGNKEANAGDSASSTTSLLEVPTPSQESLLLPEQQPQPEVAPIPQPLPTAEVERADDLIRAIQSDPTVPLNESGELAARRGIFVPPTLFRNFFSYFWLLLVLLVVGLSYLLLRRKFSARQPEKQPEIITPLGEEIEQESESEAQLIANQADAFEETHALIRRMQKIVRLWDNERRALLLGTATIATPRIDAAEYRILKEIVAQIEPRLNTVHDILSGSSPRRFATALTILNQEFYLTPDAALRLSSMALSRKNKYPGDWAVQIHELVSAANATRRQ